MTTIKEQRAELEAQESPVIIFNSYRLDADNQFSAIPEALRKLLAPLSNKGDMLVIPELDNALPVKPLRDWLKVCPAELLRVTIVKSYEYIAWHNRTWDTVTYDGILVEYEHDGLKNRAFFAACGLNGSQYRPNPKSLIMRLEFGYGLRIEQPEQPVTKSERMAALNVERARIMREYKPGPERTELLQALYTAFGNSQRKNPRPSWELPGIACGMNARFNNVIIDRRIAHNVTGALCDIHHPAIMTSDTILTPAKSL